MNRLSKLCVIACLAITAQACSSSICHNLETAFEKLDKKGEACFDSDESDEITAEDRATCEKETEACTADDAAKVEAYVDCVDALPSCVKGQEADYSTKNLECLNHLADLSKACQIFGL